MRPLILITPDYDQEPPQRYHLKRAYSDAVLAAGGLPLIAPYDTPIEALLQLAQGLVVSGGAFDLPPETYGEERRPACGPANVARTEFERGLLEAALEARIPVLGVCGGMQLLNVVRGGSLFQDLPSEREGSLAHEQKLPKDQPSHGLELEASTMLASLCGASSKQINSTHHQALKEVGRDLVVTAKAPDGVIEAIEDPSLPFVLGVQWHPELMLETEPWNLGIYRGLVEAAIREASS